MVALNIFLLDTQVRKKYISHYNMHPFLPSFSKKMMAVMQYIECMNPQYRVSKAWLLRNLQFCQKCRCLYCFPKDSDWECFE